MPVGIGILAAAADDEVVARGARLYRTYCTSCHGAGGKGDGPMADQLRYAPPDLTRIAKRARGKFSTDDVARTIDGRKPNKGHGGSEMPVWGDAFKSTEEGYDESTPDVAPAP